VGVRNFFNYISLCLELIGQGVGPLFVVAKLLITLGFRRDQPSLSTGIRKVLHRDLE